MIYMVTFALSIGCLHIADKYNYNKYIKIVFFSIAVLVPVWLAAVRDIKVGTDVMVYVRPHFMKARYSEGLFSYLKSVGNMEPLYAVVTYVVAHFSNRLSVLFAVNQLLVIIPVYIVIWKLRNEISLDLSAMVFFFFFYCHGYNTIRQSIAMSFVLLGYIFLQKQKYICFGICVLLAVGFHYSAIVALGIGMIYILLQSRQRKIFAKILIIGIFIVVYSYDIVFRWICGFLSFVPARYIYSSYLYKEMNWPIADTCILLLAVLIGGRLFKYHKGDGSFLCVIAFCALAGIFVDNVASFSSRIFWYFQYFIIIILPQGAQFFKNTMFNRLAYKFFLLCILCVYWWVHFAYGQAGKVWPYIFA